jgi:hypothetical protein
MVSDELGRQLHDKATRGGALTAQERLQLDEWYREQDAAESQHPDRTTVAAQVTMLRTQVAEGLAQIQAATADIQSLAASNETLRREAAVLRERLAKRPIPQPT